MAITQAPSAQVSVNKANLAKALSAIAKGGGSAVSAQNFYKGNTTPVTASKVSSAMTVAPRSSSSGSGSSVPNPVTQAPMMSKAGTVGNPAGSQLPTGTASLNAKAANSASSVGMTKPKEDWRATLASVQASNVASQNAGGIIEPSAGYGMTKDPNAIAPVKQTASAFDAFQSAQNNRVNTDLRSGGLDAAAGNRVPTSYTNMMTRQDGSNQPNPPAPAIDYKGLMAKSSLSGGSPSPINNQASALQSITTGSPSVSNPQQTSQPVSTQSAPTQTTSSSQPSVNPVSKVGLSNVTTKAPALDNVQAVAGIADEKKAQADAAEQAVATATTNEDKKYYQDLATKARSEADSAEAEYQSLLQQSEQEKQVQAQLDAETQALRLGQTDVAGQAIPLAFITGQQSALERRSLDRTAPLSSKLGQLQAARQAALEGAKQKISSRDNRLNTASSNLESYTSEQRKRQQQLADNTTKRANEVEDRNYKTANPVLKTTANTTPSGVKVNTYKDAQQVPETLRNSVLDDIVINQGDLPSIISAYPEISPNVIQAMFNQFSMQGKGLNSSGREL